MAKPEDSDPDSGEVENPTGLTKELQKLIKLIIDEHDYGLEIPEKAISILSSLKDTKVRGIEITDEAIRIVSSLKELKLTESVSSPDVVPEEFKCPISRQIMGDPVVVASGMWVCVELQTYDRPFILEWFGKGHNTCPQTNSDLANSDLTPNHLLRRIIVKWCTDRGIELPNAVQDINGAVRNNFPDRGCLNSLLDNMSSSASSLSDKKSSAKTLRQLTKQYPPFRDIFGSHDISKLLTPLSILGNNHDVPDLHQDIITTIFNISLPAENRKVVAETPLVIPLLIDALITGTVKTKSNAAAALFKLSSLDSNRTLIGESGALKHLIHLVKEGHPLTMNEVTSAIYQLCHCVITGTYKERAVNDGAVRVILRKIMEGAFVDLLLPILATFSSNLTAVQDMGKMGAVACLLKIMRERSNKDSNIVESCAMILFDICSYDKSKLNEVKQEETLNDSVSRVVQSGTQRARRKANEILNMLNKSG